MDPNEALRQMLRHVEELHHGNLSDMAAADAGRLLADAVKDMDEWLRRGGFLPSAWRAALGAA